MLDPRRLIHVPETGYIVIVPTEDELLSALTSKRQKAQDSVLQLFEAFGLSRDSAERMAPAAREVALRSRIAKYTKRRLAETRHVPQPAPKVVTATKPRPALALGGRMEERAGQIRRLKRGGLSQAAIAKRLGLSQPYVSQLMRLGA